MGVQKLIADKNFQKSLLASLIAGLLVLLVRLLSEYWEVVLILTLVLAYPVILYLLLRRTVKVKEDADSKTDTNAIVKTVGRKLDLLYSQSSSSLWNLLPILKEGSEKWKKEQANMIADISWQLSWLLNRYQCRYYHGPYLLSKANEIIRAAKKAILQDDKYTENELRCFRRVLAIYKEIRETLKNDENVWEPRFEDRIEMV